MRGVTATKMARHAVFSLFFYALPVLQMSPASILKDLTLLRREELAEKWDNLGFSIRPMNGHVRYTWSDGNWDSGVFVPAPYQLMHINAGALHYGVSAFEGMKAFACKDGKIRLLNPELNARRMQKGAEALLLLGTAMVSNNHDRAAPKGLGAVKAAGNYAADLAPVHQAHADGYNTTLYLDAKERKFIEEFSVCNFVGITKDGRYVTPKSDTILQSTTNIMLQQLAKDRGMIVEERPIDFEKEIGNFKEIGMCGTAAVVVKVNSISFGDKVYDFEDFDVISGLRSQLTGIQCGEEEDKHGWMKEVCDVVNDSIPEVFPVQTRSFAPDMVTAEAKGQVQRMGSQAMHGLERLLLEHVVANAEPGNPDSVLAAMDAFWNKTFQAQGAEKWNVRGLKIEEAVRDKVQAKASSGAPVRCLEMGTYCGYSALRIARNLPAGGKLLSVEKDELFAAIATKIIEFAGLDDKVKIWMGTVHSEIANITNRLEHEAADFVLVDHSKERYVPDLKLLEECGIVSKETAVVGDVEVYPGDERPPKVIEEEISRFFSDRAFGLATMDDPRFLTLTNQSNNCILRFTVFARCARELGEEDTRCKYQYYRAQTACPESQLEDWMEHRARGSCHLDVLPDRSTMHVRQ
ncbi:unnamed protein product [Durusdinium trenchii]|uniref:Uncharacterized protein n=1 Tax=Durusdinium trenchii TaxID=1381693 RepID=A0ABP0JC61_9DINO